MPTQSYHRCLLLGAHRRFGYARSVYPEAIEQASNCGRYALKSGLGGIHCFVDGKPYYMGKDN